MEDSVSVPSERSERVLTTHLKPELLRACSSTSVMEGFGYHLRRGYLDGAEQADKLFDRSHRVQRYDYFLSHDWVTGRFQKFLALCMYNNLKPALIGSMATSLVAMILEIAGVLPRWGTHIQVVGKHEFQGEMGRWPILAAPVTYLVVLFFWQRIRLMLRLKTANVFFDRFCVHQTDEESKTAAILGIGAFIARSDKLLILCSSAYFTRLWCVYEVATWMHLQKPYTKMIIVPVQMVMYLFGGQCLSFVAALYSTFYSHESILVTCLSLLFAACVGILGTGMMVHGTRDLLRIRQQLTSFSMKNVTCFCCSVNHKRPDTEMELLCDRKLVCETIETWFGTGAIESNAPDNSSEGVAKFEAYVSDNLADTILRPLSGGLPAFILVAMMAYPWLWNVSTYICFYLTLPSHPYQWRLYLNQFAYMLVYVPLPVRFSFLAARLIAEESSSHGRCLRYLRTLAIVTLTSVVWCLSIGLPSYTSARTASEVPNMIVLGAMGLALLLLCLTRRMQGLAIDVSNAVPMEEIQTKYYSENTKSEILDGIKADDKPDDPPVTAIASNGLVIHVHNL